jgi:S1-C subfamily serine protease
VSSGRSAALALVLSLSCACGGMSERAQPTSTITPAPTTPSKTTSTSVAKLSNDELLDLARASVVRVRNTGCGAVSTGSAWLADDQTMISNRHVVEGLRFLEMSTWDGRDLDSKSAKVAEEADISRIAADWSAVAALRPLKVRTTPVEDGERIAIVGYPEGNELQVVTGVSTGYALDPKLAERAILKTTSVIKPGNSGGPALDMQGRVVGVAFAEEVKTDEALVIPISDVTGPDAVEMIPAKRCDE